MYSTRHRFHAQAVVHTQAILTCVDVVVPRHLDDHYNVDNLYREIKHLKKPQSRTTAYFEKSLHQFQFGGITHSSSKDLAPVSEAARAARVQLPLPTQRRSLLAQPLSTYTTKFHSGELAYCVFDLILEDLSVVFLNLTCIGIKSKGKL